MQRPKLDLAARNLAALALVSPLFLSACSADAQPAAAAASATEASAPAAETTAPDDHGGAESAALKSIRAFIAEKNIDKSVAGWKTRLPKPPKLEFAEDEKVYWNLETSEGDIAIELMHGVAPMHVSSTMYLVELGFYDDLRFHRVITNFMAQGGCPLGTGTGSPGYKYGGEFDPNVKHTKPGLLSMANAGPRTDGSQFFLTFVPTPWLDGKHTIFGEVVVGMDVVKKLESFGSQSGKTSKKLSMERSTISIGEPTIEPPHDDEGDGDEGHDEGHDDDADHDEHDGE